MPEKDHKSVSPYNFWISSGVGCLTTFVIGSVIFCSGIGITRASGFPDGISNMFGFIAASIICTGGLGLLAWIPGWYLVGALTVFIYRSLGSRLEDRQKLQGTRPHQQRHPLNPKLIAAGEYIRQARDKGNKDREIADNLRLNGWESSTIDQAFDYLRWKSGLDAGKGGAT